MIKDIVEDIIRVLDVKGCLVCIKVKYLCICSRGLLDDNSWIEFFYLIGILNVSDFSKLISFNLSRF